MRAHETPSPIDLYVDKDVLIPTLLCVLRFGGCSDSVYDERSGGGGEGGVIGQVSIYVMVMIRNQ